MPIVPGKPVTPSQFERPKCFVVQQTAQTGWTSAAATAVTFGSGSEVVDDLNAHDTGSNTSRIVIGKKLGWWQVSGVYCPAPNANTTFYRGFLYLNGVAIAGSFAGDSTAASFVGEPTPLIPVLASSPTDYIELYGLEIAASGTLGTSVSAPYVASSLTAIFLSEA